MPVLGITGGIATGKSSFTRRLGPLLGGTLFDADAAARELLSGNSDVLNRVRETFGSDVIFSDGDRGGRVSRERLREIVFRDPMQRKKLEAILHPLIRADWMAKAKFARQTGEWLTVDIPLLFEAGLENEFDVVVVVACRASTQRARIVLERGLSAEMADHIIASQQSLASKIARASHVVWSDSPMARLEEQAQILATYLNPENRS